MTQYITAVGNTYDFKYDGDGNRLERDFGSNPTRYVTDTSGELSKVLAKTYSTNSISYWYVYGLGGILNQGASTSISGREYFLEDGLGNMRFLSSYTGGKKAQTYYDPFGNVRSSSGTLPHFQFQGQWYDSEINQYHMRARYYDQTLGRFISRDPIKGALTLPQTQNPYAYSLNNPINLSDPSGLWTVDIGLSAGVGYAGVTAGVQVSETGIYGYHGVGVAQPGPGASLMWSPDSPTTGISSQAGGGFIAGGQGSVDMRGNTSASVGLTTPGYGAYTINTQPIRCF